MKVSNFLRLKLPPIFLILLAFALFANSSIKPDDVQSDNPIVSQITDRKTWKYLSSNVKLSTYRKFPYEKKQNFWQLKHEELKALNWNIAEREHINSLYAIICEYPEVMERGLASQEQEDTFEVFLYNWRDYAIKTLGWTPKLIFAISGTGDEVLNIEGDLKSNGAAWNINYSTRFIPDCSMCENVPDPKVPHFIPYPGNCRAYFTCIMGTAYPNLCPEGLRFDNQTQSCTWPSNVSCPDDLDYQP